MFRKNSDQLAQILEIYYGLSFRLFGKKRNIFLKQKWVWHQFEYTIIKELNSSLRGSKGFSIAHVLLWKLWFLRLPPYRTKTRWTLLTSVNFFLIHHFRRSLALQLKQFEGANRRDPTVGTRRAPTPTTPQQVGLITRWYSESFSNTLRSRFQISRHDHRCQGNRLEDPSPD